MADVSWWHTGAGNATTPAQQPPALQPGNPWVDSQEIGAQWSVVAAVFCLSFLNPD